MQILPSYFTIKIKLLSNMYLSCAPLWSIFVLFLCFVGCNGPHKMHIQKEPIEKPTRSTWTQIACAWLCPCMSKSKVLYEYNHTPDKEKEELAKDREKLAKERQETEKERQEIILCINNLGKELGIENIQETFKLEKELENVLKLFDKMLDEEDSRTELLLKSYKNEEKITR